MNKALLASSTLLVSALLSQSAVAGTVKTLDKEALIASSADYQLEYTERAKPRRSALFAMILDQMAQRATLAKLDSAATDKDASTISES